MCVRHSYMSLHPLRVSLGIVRGWRWVRRTSRASILCQFCLRTLLAWPSPLSRWIHLICRSFLYGRGKAHAIAGVLWGISIVVTRQLIGAIKQTTVSRIISWWLKSGIWRHFLNMCCPGEGVELGISGMRHPGRGTRVITSCSWTWNYTGRNSTTDCSWWSTCYSTGLPAGGVWRAKLSLVVYGSGLGSYFIMGGGMNIVVAICWILWLEEKVIRSCYIHFSRSYFAFGTVWFLSNLNCD